MLRSPGDSLPKSWRAVLGFLVMVEREGEANNQRPTVVDRCEAGGYEVASQQRMPHVDDNESGEEFPVCQQLMKIN